MDEDDVIRSDYTHDSFSVAFVLFACVAMQRSSLILISLDCIIQLRSYSVIIYQV